MPNLLDFSNFNRRLWLSGGRSNAPADSLRRCRGVAPELTGSIRSMYPPQLLYANINALNLVYFQDNRYQFDGSKLYKNGAAIYSTGFNGNRGTFVSMPPALGLTDSLFMCGAGQNIKVDTAGNVTNWGIQYPTNSMVAANNAQEQIVIINPNADTHGDFTSTTNVTVTDETGIITAGTHSLKFATGAQTAWQATIPYGSAQNWGNYSSGDFVLPTDLFQIWVYIDAYPSGASAGFWIEFDVDVHDQGFTKDWYSFSVGFLPATVASPTVKHDVNTTVTFQVGQWQQITVPQQSFLRNGTARQLDWTMVQALRIKGGNVPTATNIYLSDFTISGGAPLGAGPAAGNGGSEYSYYAVYRNLTTGNQSNPQATPTNTFANSCQSVTLSQIPISSDPQVGARDLYRTSAENAGGGQTAYYLDTIYDNSTTTYTDTSGDTSVPKTLTPWVKNIAVPPATPTHISSAHYYVDGGNGYYFKLTTNGTTGSGPSWNIPTTTWVALGTFFANDTVSPLLAAGNLFKCTVGGISGASQPDWAGTGVNSTVQDGSVTWLNTGPATTADGTAVWTFQGINSMPVLGNQAVLLDNTVPPSTINDAVGPFQGSMVMTRDTASGFGGYVYLSPPGRAESVGLAIRVSSDDEPCQKAVIFQDQLWIITTNGIYRSNGTYPNISFEKVFTEGGTNFPFTVLSTDKDVFYRGYDGIRRFTWGANQLIAFEAIAPVLRGETVEDVPPFYPTVCGLMRDEVMFSDGVTSMALSHEHFVWRSFDVGFSAMIYEEETGEIVASYGGNVYLWEHQSFAGAPLAFDFEVQTPSVEPDPSRSTQTKRLYVDIDTVSQKVTPTLLVDNKDITLPAIVTPNRQTIEIPYQYPGRVIGVRFTATPNLGQVQIYRVSADNGNGNT